MTDFLYVLIAGTWAAYIASILSSTATTMIYTHCRLVAYISMGVPIFVSLINSLQ